MAIPDEVLAPLVHLQLDGALTSNLSLHVIPYISPLSVLAASPFLPTLSLSFQLLYQGGKDGCLAIIEVLKSHRFAAFKADVHLHIKKNALLFEQSL